MPEPEHIHLNDTVWVILTDRGREVYRQHYLDSGHYHPNSIQSPVLYQDQLWGIMRIFGPVMRLGMSLVFEDSRIYSEKPTLE